MTPAKSPTVVVELTPPGRGAVAVVLVAGPRAMRSVGDCFTPVSARPLADLPLGRIALGRWGGPDSEELIVCRRAEAQIEIHSHGGLAAVRTVIDDLIDRGCCHTSWQEWQRRAPPDPLRAAAQIALAEAPTARTAAVLLDQYHGALSNATHTAIAAIAAAEWSRAADIVDDLLRFRELGMHLTTPWRVVLAGAPNVGKSSLINALAGYQRAIVSPLPGTTRDVVTLTTAIDGWPVQLADTAGLRATDDELEAAGVALADAALAEADLVIVVSDASANIDAAPEAVSRSPNTARMIQVCNKIDLAGVEDNPARLKLKAERGRQTFVSAATGEGVAELAAEISRLLVPIAPPAGAAVAFTADQLARLSAARTAIDERNAAAAEAAMKALLARKSDRDE